MTIYTRICTYVCAYKYATKADEADALLPLLTSAAMSSAASSAAAAAAVDDFSPIRKLLNVLHSLCLWCLLPSPPPSAWPDKAPMLIAQIMFMISF